MRRLGSSTESPSTQSRDTKEAALMDELPKKNQRVYYKDHEWIVTGKYIRNGYSKGFYQLKLPKQDVEVWVNEAVIYKIEELP